MKKEKPKIEISLLCSRVKEAVDLLTYFHGAEKNKRLHHLHYVGMERVVSNISHAFLALKKHYNYRDEKCEFIYENVRKIRDILFHPETDKNKLEDYAKIERITIHGPLIWARTSDSIIENKYNDIVFIYGKYYFYLTEIFLLVEGIVAFINKKIQEERVPYPPLQWTFVLTNNVLNRESPIRKNTEGAYA